MDELESTGKSSDSPTDIEEIRTNDSIVILREKIRGRSSRNLLLREAAYDTVRAHTAMIIQ